MIGLAIYRLRVRDLAGHNRVVSSEHTSKGRDGKGGEWYGERGQARGQVEREGKGRTDDRRGREEALPKDWFTPPCSKSWKIPCLHCKCNHGNNNNNNNNNIEQCNCKVVHSYCRPLHTCRGFKIRLKIWQHKQIKSLHNFESSFYVWYDWRDWWIKLNANKSFITAITGEYTVTWRGAIRSYLVLLYINLTISFNGIQPRRLVVILTDCIKQIRHAGLELYFSQNGLSISGTICQCPRILAHCRCSCVAFGLRICLVIYICNQSIVILFVS